MIWAAAQAPAGQPLLSAGHVFDAAIGLGIIALAIVLLPLWLAGSYRKSKAASTPGQPASFFQIPYITWFIVHYGIAALAIVAIVFLGIDGVIDKGTVSALLGSLFGYVLGSSSRGSQTAPAKGALTLDSHGEDGG